MGEDATIDVDYTPEEPMYLRLFIFGETVWFTKVFPCSTRQRLPTGGTSRYRLNGENLKLEQLPAVDTV